MSILKPGMAPVTTDLGRTSVRHTLEPRPFNAGKLSLRTGKALLTTLKSVGFKMVRSRLDDKATSSFGQMLDETSFKTFL